MEQYTSDVAFTPAVKAVQERLGSRGTYARMEQQRGWETMVNSQLKHFIAQRDSFYLATASADGQPYIQHRGGPKGFLKVLDDKTLALADFSGNRQHISVGNLGENNRITLFLMDYANRTRIKVWGRAETVDDDPDLLKQLADPAYSARVERAIKIHVEAWDVNCPQHITPRFTREEIDEETSSLKARVTTLEKENSELRDEVLAGAPE